MEKFAAAAALAVLLTATPAFAQVASQPSDPGTIRMGETGYHQTQMLAGGKITVIDFAEGTVTLDNGMQFTLAPSLQYTSFPALGQEVEVTYEEHSGKNVARVIDVVGTNNGSGD
jgi:opacity protein-like surface antigen